MIIVGNDPYTTPGYATGNAFAVNKYSAIQPALSSMIDELAINYYHDLTLTFNYEARTLEHWVEQGVMLLNSSLTASDYKPESYDDLFINGTHSHYWRIVLMEDFFQHMNDCYDNILFVFLGDKAQYYNKFITNSKHGIINEAYPGNDFRLNKKIFVGSKLFGRINDWLISKNKKQIEWVKKIIN